MEHVDMDSLLSKYFVDGDWRGMDQQGNGMNNTTRFVLAGGERYVLRIYETHRDEDKVRYEHAVLLRLVEQRLSFGTPVLARAKNGETFVYTTEGKLAALFRYQEGVRPTYWDGVDSMEVVKRQIHNAYSMALWLRKHEDKLLDAFKDDNLACLTI